MAKRISQIIEEFDQNKKILEFNDFTIVPGNSNMIISAPHAFSHVRNNKIKCKDKLTLTIIKMIKQLTNVHVIYLNKDAQFDPNYDLYNDYQTELIKYIKENNIEYLIDIHGTKLIKDVEIEIGTNHLKNINSDENLLTNVVEIFKKNKFRKIRIDKKYSSSKNTICNIINKETNIKTLQFEISKGYRSIKEDINKFKILIQTLIDVIYYMERSDKMKDLNYVLKYDEVLDIKPSYGYKRELGVINYNQVGLEIEVSVNFNRNSYSFIKKLLKKIKNLVGDNGYFVKDGTILGDYSFEIVLDPLTVEEIEKFYTSLLEIIEFSQGTIEISKEMNCGIHMNFNRKDILDINEAHKKALTFTKENPTLFDSNKYKQFKFIWDYDKYYEYQKVIGDKYLWINYLKKKVVEVRNVKANVNVQELVKVLNAMLQALYYDKEEIKQEQNTFFKLDKLYDTVFNDTDTQIISESLHQNEFVIIGVKDAKAKIVTLTDDLIEQIKNIL